jgi:Asp-tRNA(Asn)/Glu-tRNA(Gln) amidotransferase A subunit family amidase
MLWRMRRCLPGFLAGLWLCLLSSDVDLGAQATASRRPALAAFDVIDRSIADLQAAMHAGQVTSRQLVELYLARIEAYDKSGPALNAITVLNPDARAAADALDAERRSGRVRGPLHGIPVLVKDNYETVEMPTSAGSIALAGFHPPRDAYQVRRLREAGAVVLGKTNMHELAAGITTVGSRFGQTKNPYDLDRNPGGSSGGTGAAIAANFATAGMGSDTCGSIRIPAANNNLVGLRGTQGLASRTGIVPLSSTQDIGGPIARGIVDLATMLDATVGADPADADTAASAGRIPASYRDGLRADALKGARIGVLRTLFGSAPEDQEVTGIVQKSLDALKAAGADVVDVAVPGLEDLLRDSSMINADFKFDLAEYLAGAPNPPVTSLGDILERGLYHQALEGSFRARNNVERRDTDAARRARIKRGALRQAVEAVLDEHRLVALAYPTLRRKPARIGDAQGGTTCQLSAHSGLPALSVPAGFSADDVPIGLELLGGAFQEQALLSLGYGIEQTLKLRRPPFSTPALIEGAAPPPRALTVTSGKTVVALVYDESASRLNAAIRGDVAGRHDVEAIWLHAGTVDKPAAARHRLFGAGLPPAATIALSAADRRDLAAGRLVLRVYRRAGSAISVDTVSVPVPR